MRLSLTRKHDSGNATIGALSIDGEPVCDTLENPWKNNARRVSRIPPGEYEIKFRTVSRANPDDPPTWHDRALAKFGGDFHKGMLELQGVPDRDYILIHWGNKPADTQGCILLGEACEKPDWVSNSVTTYCHVYAKIADRLLNNRRVFITVVNWTHDDFLEAA